MAPRLILATALALFVLLLAVQIVKADHQRVLADAPNTPAIQNLLSDGSRAWCVNAAANNYPNFVSQLQQIYDSQFNTLGNTNHQVPGTFETPSAALASGCEVLWVGRYDSFCVGCSCNVYYASWPVTVNVKLSLGFFDWKSCQGHEEGHVHGLGEFYIDADGQLKCDNGYQAMVIRLGFASVMSCGTLVWELQPADVDLICQIYGVAGQRFRACAPDPAPCGNPCYDGEWWNFSDGWSVNPSTGEWRTPYGWIEWRDCVPAGCFNPAIGRFVSRGSGLYSPNFNLTTSPP